MKEFSHIERWSLPPCYVGAHWPDYFSAGVGQSRDSDPLERANFTAMLNALGGESNHPTIEDPNDPGCALSLVRVIRENHWAVGWVEWIAIHESQSDKLAIANAIQQRLGNYPVIDDDLLSQYENDEANEVWRDCYNVSERCDYIRKHPSHFDFRNFQDLIGCVRGLYFAGNPSQLIQ